jgi:hypothetical protein
MVQEFLRLTVYVAIGEADEDSGSEAASAAAVQEILRVFLEYDFTGSFGTYRTVVGISAGAETFVRTEDSALAYGAAGRRRPISRRSRRGSDKPRTRLRRAPG